MKLIFALLTGLMFLSACELQQDPISGAPDAVREGRPPGVGKPIPQKPLPKEALYIDAPTLVNGRVGNAIEFQIFGRVMSPDMGFSLVIENLHDFPGAVFNAATGEFSWTPSKDIVGSFPSVEVLLRVALITEATEQNPTISIEKKSVSVVIANSYSKPIVNSVTGASTVIAGTSNNFNFVFEDIDAFGASDAQLMVRDCPKNYYSESISHFVNVGRLVESNTGNGKFEGYVTLNLSKADNILTGRYCFGVAAVSKHGVVSELFKYDINIEAKIKQTRMTMEHAPEVALGSKVSFAFAIYDSTNQGSVSWKNEKAIADKLNLELPGSTIKCNQAYNMKFQLNCQGVLDTTQAEVKVYTFDLEILNEISRSTQSVTTKHPLRFNVKAAN